MGLLLYSSPTSNNFDYLTDQPSLQLLPDDPLLNGKQQVPIKQQTKETELRIELTDHPSPESEGQVDSTSKQTLTCLGYPVPKL